MKQIKSAIDHLQSAERVFVLGYVARLLEQASQAHQPVSALLHQTIPDSHVEDSKGFLDRPLVLAAIHEELRREADRAELSPQRLINEYMAIAFSSLEGMMQETEYATTQGQFTTIWDVDIRNLTSEQWAAISEINVDYDKVTGLKKSTKIKLHNKLEALKQLGEYMAVLYRDNKYWQANQAKGESGVITSDMTPEQTANAYARMIAGT